MKIRIFSLSKLLLFTILCSGTAGLAQQIPADSIPARFNRYRKSVQQEKIYLQTDRPSYLAGETMWFSVYLTDASLHKSSAISKVAYIEILDRFSQPVLQTKISLKEGRGNGSVFLPATINSGNYQLRTYTNWMKNFDESFFFHKTITILNTFRKIEPETTPNASTLDAQFFPEGGNLLSGISGKVAFRVTDQRGKGISFSGYLLNEQNDTLAHFKPVKFGIGNFTFTPSADHKYRAVIREASGKVTIINLPAVAEQGYAMQVTDSTDQIAIAVSSQLPETSLPVVYVFIHARQIMVHSEVKFLQNNKAEIRINKSALPEGISHITIFDSNLQPVCERLYFKRLENHLAIALQTDQAKYAGRRRVTLDLQTTYAGTAKPADLTVSVYKTDSISEFPRNMVEYFWLTSDLKGNIESPEYYFSATSPEVTKATDNLMLTHGWRRFNWNEVLNAKQPSFSYVPEYHSHIIQGTVKTQQGQPAPGILTYLASPGKVIRIYGARSNNNGRVLYEMQGFRGSASIVVQTNPKIDSTYKLEIESPFLDQDNILPLPSLTIRTTSEKTLLDRSVAMQVQDIYYGEQQEKAETKAAGDTIAFYGIADETYYLDAFTRFPVMEEVMREYVPGVLVRKRKDGFHFLVLDNVNRKVFDETPLILIDGVPLFDADEIMSFDPKRIKKLEVMTREYFLGPLRFPGVVSYTTYAGDLSGFPIQPGAIRMNYEGLQLQREYFSPRYESPKQRESRMPDQRTLLYWNPAVLTDAQGNKQVEFYTSDITGEYKIVVEGISTDGHPGNSTHTISVNVINN